MIVKTKDRPSADAMAADRTLERITFWKLPNGDMQNDPNQNVEFAEKQASSFFKMLKDTVKTVKSKKPA